MALLSLRGRRAIDNSVPYDHGLVAGNAAHWAVHELETFRGTASATVPVQEVGQKPAHPRFFKQLHEIWKSVFIDGLDIVTNAVTCLRWLSDRRDDGQARMKLIDVNTGHTRAPEWLGGLRDLSLAGTSPKPLLA